MGRDSRSARIPGAPPILKPLELNPKAETLNPKPSGRQKHGSLLLRTLLPSLAASIMREATSVTNLKHAQQLFGSLVALFAFFFFLGGGGGARV